MKIFEKSQTFWAHSFVQILVWEYALNVFVDDLMFRSDFTDFQSQTFCFVNFSYSFSAFFKKMQTLSVSEHFYLAQFYQLL